MNKFNLLKYAIDYLSKYSASKKHLEKILKAKIIRFTKNKKERFELYNQINHVLLQLEKNNLINDNIFMESKINLFVSQGKSKIFIENYLIQKGVEKSIVQNQINELKKNNDEWEKECAFIFAKKKKLFDNSIKYEKKLSKMARAGFPYEICKEILKID